MATLFYYFSAILYLSGFQWVPNLAESIKNPWEAKSIAGLAKEACGANYVPKDSPIKCTND